MNMDKVAASYNLDRSCFKYSMSESGKLSVVSFNIPGYHGNLSDLLVEYGHGNHSNSRSLPKNWRKNRDSVPAFGCEWINGQWGIVM